MLRILLFFFFFSQYQTATTENPDYPSINCDYFPVPSETDEGNYGDGNCSISGHFQNEELVVRKILTTNEGETYLHDLLNFPNNVITRVKLLNFGRYHGATNSIGIYNKGGAGTVDINVEVFSGKGVRMFLEIYGIYPTTTTSYSTTTTPYYTTTTTYFTTTSTPSPTTTTTPYYTTTSPYPTSTTYHTTSTTTEKPDYPSINCDYFPVPSENDEGNYGDGVCSVEGDFQNEQLVASKILTTNEGETYLHDLLNFPNKVITKVKLFNFGRYHGATNTIAIYNKRGEGNVDINVDVFSGKGVRMFLEVYGF